MWVCALYRVGGCVGNNLEVDGGVFFAGKAGWREVSGRFRGGLIKKPLIWISAAVLNGFYY